MMVWPDPWTYIYSDHTCTSFKMKILAWCSWWGGNSNFLSLFLCLLSSLKIWWALYIYAISSLFIILTLLNIGIFLFIMQCLLSLVFQDLLHVVMIFFLFSSSLQVFFYVFPLLYSLRISFLFWEKALANEYHSWKGKITTQITYSISTCLMERTSYDRPMKVLKGEGFIRKVNLN